ncbi:period circadian protein-like isoform X1 [Daphnia pulex]|uniref:period circadian protein-like isoform X1 n=1 Tax=Daphnia pulex TaxID=6669 RepID=UPI001EDCCEE3|nr:period circadian protein-like isoform X1 [Daphnia pulex]XP_046445919.1 period circadian protein-like isoform X1 [Daphnia pulex]XP_046445920.1 period circadian protein-like isoform X1 [Daphnia pulex]XP_046445921.1 period circadian protein-like isoform X1 [Daphnia pulex]XP_046445922.1 period circadian protein-like isoform X1 [Daphnia pulex]
MSENDGSSKSSSGPSSGSSRMDSAGSAAGSSAGNSHSIGAPSSHAESDSFQHSHMSLKGTSNCNISATSDSAYGGSISNSQSQRSGSGSGSRSSKSQISSNSSNNAGAQQPPKLRKEKDPKKRKSKQASIPPVQSPGLTVDRPASAGSNKAAASAAAVISATSLAMANVFTVEGGDLVTTSGPSPSDSTGFSSGTGASIGGSTGIASATNRNTRIKIARSTIGIRGFTESRAVQAAALSRALDCLKGTGLGPSKESISSSKCGKEDATTSSWRSIIDPLESSLKKTFAHLEEVPTVKSKEAFIAAISLQDGIVVYVTPSLTEKLGYPVEMWCGRSLLDFIHPKDRLAFTNQITSKLLASLDKDDSSSGYSFSSDEGLFPRGSMIGSSSSPPNMLCCRLRMYRGLRTSGFGIVDKKTSYLPFKIILNLEKITLPRESPESQNEKETVADGSVPKNPEEDDSDSAEYYLLAYAVPISTAYKNPDEKNSTGEFGLRHSANCLFSEVDMSSVPYLGHLPQDLLGTSALDFYHPNDLPELKKIYDSVIGRQGKSLRSKPYNFRAFNGCYVLLQTDWTCFVNPWTKKLEFVAGHHRVLKGPSNPDVFANPPEGTVPFVDLDPTAAENTKKLHAEICTILTGSAKPPHQARTSHNRVDTALLETATRRRKNLATLMGSLIDEVAKARGSNSCGNSCSSSTYARCKPQLHSPAEEGSLLGDASVVMGDISTHGGSAFDSNSADTPLSYSLLNYNQNLERYFQSQPKMMPSDGSGESIGSGSGDSKPGKNQTPNMSSEEEGGCLGTDDTFSGTLPSTDSQKLSSSNSNSISNSRSTDSQNGMPYEAGFKGLPLTKEAMARHNEEMEKEFMQQHRYKTDLRNRSTPGHRCGPPHCRKDLQGVKRGQAASWEEGGAGGRHKHPHMDAFCATPHCYQNPLTGAATGPFNDWASLTSPSLIPSNLLPPFSVSATMPNQQSPLFSIPMTNRGEVTNSLPAFYLATSAGATSSGIRSNNGMSMGPSPYMVQNEHHHQSLGPAFSLQPYAAYPHGVIYQPVMVPPMLFQPGLGMMMSPSPSMTQPQSSRHRPFLHQNYQSENRHRQPQPYRLSSGHVDNPVAGPSYRDDGAANANSIEQQNSSYRQQFREASASRQQGTEQYGSNQAQNQAQAPSNQQRPTCKRIPPWMEAVSVSNELVYQYQIPGRNSTDVLEADRERLRLLQQPVMLNHQLMQLYTEMEAEQRNGIDLALDDSENSISSRDTDETNHRRRELRRRSNDFRRTMLYEENAPFPHPESSSTDG